MTSTISTVPLCVDLDNSLIGTNTLIEAIVSALRHNPALIFLIPFWAIRGRAYIWAMLVDRFRPEAPFLPYSEPVLRLIRSEAASGRMIFLATGAHERMARDVAVHLGLFSGFFATDGLHQMAGSDMADALTAQFGAKGFDYVGDSSDDMDVFRSCRRAYIVSRSPSLMGRLQRESILAVNLGGERPAGRWASLLSAARPRQWVKNILVLVPILLSHRFLDATALRNSLLTCLLLCLACSSAYLLNDILDVEADRRHHTKRRRPFAQGTVSIQTGTLVGVTLAALAVGLGWLVGPPVSLLLALYLVTTLTYSVWLKKVLIVDVMLLAFFYVFRVYLGAAATGIRISSWTALFCLFIFLGLAVLKRYAEMHNRAPHTLDADNRRAYRQEDAMPLLSIGTSSFIGAIVALGLYAGSPDVRVLYRTPDLLWLVCPILFAWMSRLWILANRGELRDEDPVAFALRDHWSHGAAVLSALIFLFAL